MHSEPAIEQLVPPQSRWWTLVRGVGWMLVGVYFVFAALVLGLRYWFLPNIGNYNTYIEQTVSGAGACPNRAIDEHGGSGGAVWGTTLPPRRPIGDSRRAGYRFPFWARGLVAAVCLGARTAELAVAPDAAPPGVHRSSSAVAPRR